MWLRVKKVIDVFNNVYKKIRQKNHVTSKSKQKTTQCAILCCHFMFPTCFPHPRKTVFWPEIQFKNLWHIMPWCSIKLLGDNRQLVMFLRTCTTLFSCKTLDKYVHLFINVCRLAGLADRFSSWCLPLIANSFVWKKFYFMH